MLEKNSKFQVFREALAARGVRIVFGWSAYSGQRPTKKTPDNVCQIQFHGSGFTPGVLWAIVIDYGDRDGFALCTDDSATIQADVDRIAGPNAKPRETFTTGEARNGVAP